MRAKRQQSGFALLIFLMILIGMGAFVVEGYMQNISKDIQQNHYQKNKFVLQQAKSALLQYAYSYPQFNDDAPGRLPCPYDEESGYSGPLSSALCNKVGRFPWASANMNFYDAKDASSEYLWYAVSENFYNFNPGGTSVINSDTKGTITLVDQSGAVIYNGSVAGIAAVIIAPGVAINRDENNDGVYEYAQVRSTATEIKDPRNYLDTFNGFDNSVFVNSSAATADGFILGPIKDQALNSVVVNDQMIVVTADEVIAMAEKAVLEQYSLAISSFRANVIGGDYPWLFDYAISDPDMQSYNSGRTNIGRIPSIFSEYYSDNDSEPIDTRLRITVSKTYNVTGIAGAVTTTLSKLTVSDVPNMRFDDLGSTLDNLIRLSADPLAETLQQSTYFYDDVVPTGWTVCAGGADELTDCNRDSAGNNTPGSGSNDTASKILRVGIQLDLTSGVSFDINVSSPLSTTYLPLTFATHAEILKQFAPTEVSNMSASFFYQEGDYATGTTPAFTVTSSATQAFENDSDFGTTVTNQSRGNIVIGMRYYPELPGWAKASQNNWHKSILMAVSSGYQPGASSNCTSANCLTVGDMGGVTDNKVALLLMAGSSNIVDTSSTNYSDDLDQIFDPGNFDLDRNFFKRNGDDTIFILQEQ